MNFADLEDISAGGEKVLDAFASHLQELKKAHKQQQAVSDTLGVLLGAQVALCSYLTPEEVRKTVLTCLHHAMAFQLGVRAERDGGTFP